MKALVIENIQETHDVKCLRIKPDSIFPFKPGQFIMVSHKAVKDGTPVEVKRPYSIASSPLNHNYIELAFDIKEFGLVSPYLYNLKENDAVEISGPNGFFTFDDSIKDELILIGAGTGIAPLIGISRYITEKKLSNKITLIYSCKTKKDIIYHEEVKRIKKHHNNFDYHITLTQEEWDGLSGRINSNLIKKLISDFNNKIFYLCGPPKMVIEISKELQELGVLKDRIKLEGYE